MLAAELNYDVLALCESILTCPFLFPRDDGDASEPAELAKRVCTMTESNMSAKRHTASSQLNRPSTSKATEYDVRYQFGENQNVILIA